VTITLRFVRLVEWRTIRPDNEDMRIRLLAAAAAVATISVVLPAFVHGASPGGIDQAALTTSLTPAKRLDPPKPKPTPLSAAVIDLVNAERAARGLPAMVWDQRLELAAQRHSDDQAAMRRLSHTGSDGSSLVERLARVGFSWRAAGENVASGQTSAASVVSAWMNSAGHRANILSGNTRIGVGFAVGIDGHTYWTQVFATPG
jgi:uncharacterized protein YkwD